MPIFFLQLTLLSLICAQPQPTTTPTGGFGGRQRPTLTQQLDQTTDTFGRPGPTPTGFAGRQGILPVDGPEQFGGRDRDGEGRFGRDFVIDSPVFMQCTCADAARRGECRTWSCLDFDLVRRERG